jgi:hypothetical protein
MINTELGKNKVFFAPKFGSAPFYFYTLIVRGTGWGEAGQCKCVCRPLMLSARGKLPIMTVSLKGTAFAVFFLYLVTSFLCYYNKPAF